MTRPSFAPGPGFVLALLLGCALPSGVATPEPSPQPPALPLAVERLAWHLRIPPEEVEVVEVQATTFENGCLDLPGPERCPLGPIEGFRVRLRALGAEYRYHTTRGESFRYAGPGDSPQRPGR